MNNWMDWRGASKIQKFRVKNWVKDMLEELRANPQNDYHFTASGNRFVLAHRSETGNIEVWVLKPLKSRTFKA